MTIINKLGIFWGTDSLSLIEASRGQVVKLITLPLNTPQDAKDSSDIPEGLKITAHLQKAFLENNFSAKRVCLSLPSHILIFRSFTIPWMQPDEIKNVVDFEATKYIPIKLEELVFTYHAVPFVDKGQKNIRILFVAIKKELLDYYTGIFRHSNLPIEYVEPGPVSLYRALRKQKMIAPTATCAIIEIEKAENRIIIVDKEVVQFVRESQLAVDRDPAQLGIKLINDTRVSFNFFSRQNPQNPVTDIVLCSLTDLTELSQSLATEFSLPVKNVLATELVQQGTISDLGFMRAYGAAIRDKAPTTKDFDLYAKSEGKHAVEADIFAKVAKYKAVAITALSCLAVVFLTIILAHQMLGGFNRRLAELKNQQGTFASSDLATIEQMEKQLAEKLAKYTQIRTDGQINFFLYKLPEILPKGTWLRSFQIEYVETTSRTPEGSELTVSKPRITLDGYAYSENPNEQFRIINNFIVRLKEEKKLGEYFTSIEREAIRQETLDQYTVTSFRITCQ